jgi:uncharacterized protein YjiS (DUF1127 family)
MTSSSKTVTIAGRRYARPQRHAWTVLTCAFVVALARFRERRALTFLNDRQLRDIGLTREDVQREAERWPWDGVAR